MLYTMCSKAAPAFIYEGFMKGWLLFAQVPQALPTFAQLLGIPVALTTVQVGCARCVKEWQR